MFEVVQDKRGLVKVGKEKLKPMHIVKFILISIAIYFTLHFMSSKDVYEALFTERFSTFDAQRVILPVSFRTSILASLVCLCVYFSDVLINRLEMYERVFSAICAFIFTAGYSIRTTGSFLENFLISENWGGITKYYSSLFC